MPGAGPDTARARRRPRAPRRRRTQARAPGGRRASPAGRRQAACRPPRSGRAPASSTAPRGGRHPAASRSRPSGGSPRRTPACGGRPAPCSRPARRPSAARTSLSHPYSFQRVAVLDCCLSSFRGRTSGAPPPDCGRIAGTIRAAGPASRGCVRQSLALQRNHKNSTRCAPARYRFRAGSGREMRIM